MRLPTRMRQVYDGGPPGSFKFPFRPLTVVFVAVLSFALIHRLGVFSVADDSVIDTRLDVAAAELEVHYDRRPPALGRVTGVSTDATHVDVTILLSETQRSQFLAAPETLRAASVQAVCPGGGERVWDRISVKQSIRVRARAPDGTELLQVECRRYRI